MTDKAIRRIYSCRRDEQLFMYIPVIFAKKMAIRRRRQNVIKRLR